MIRDREPVGVEDFLDHVDHVARLVGVEHVGIGSDQGLITEDMMPLAYRKGRLEGAPAKYHVHTDADERIGIAGLDSPRRSFDIAAGLVRRGYSDGDVGLVLGGNFARVLKQIWNSIESG
jgi:membrane dipeptidase